MVLLTWRDYKQERLRGRLPRTLSTKDNGTESTHFEKKSAIRHTPVNNTIRGRSEMKTSRRLKAITSANHKLPDQVHRSLDQHHRVDERKSNSSHEKQHTVSAGSRVVTSRDRGGRRDGHQSQRLGGSRGGPRSSSGTDHGGNVLRNRKDATGRDGERTRGRDNGQGRGRARGRKGERRGSRQNRHRRGREAVVGNRSDGDRDGTAGRSARHEDVT